MAVWHQAGGGPALVVVTVEVDRRIYDPFGRTESSSWGSTDTDEAWTTTGGSASDYSVTGGVGIQSMGSVSVTRQSELPIVVADLDVVFTTGISAAPTGDTVEQGIALRWVDSNNYVDFRIFRESGGSVTCAIRQVIAGSETASGFPTIAGVTSGSDIRIRFEASGSTIRGRAWLAGTTEPSTWDRTMTTDHLAPGALRLRSTLGGSVSNSLPLLIDFDDLLATIPDQRIEVAPLHIAGLEADMAGRVRETNVNDNATLSLSLHNADGYYTPGNIYAKYELKQGQRVWAKETIGRRSFDLFTGTLQQPEVVYGEHANDATVVVSAVDGFGAAQEAERTFVSTLAEHILYNGGDELVAYWPFGESSGTRFAATGRTRREAMILEPYGFTSLNDHTAAFEPGAGDPLVGDDLPRVVSTPQLNPAGTQALYEFIPTAELSDPITLATGEWLSVAWWAEPTSSADLTFALFGFGDNNLTILDLRRTVAADSPQQAGVWRARIKDAGITWHITGYGGPCKVNEPNFVSCTFTTSSVTINVNDTTATGTVTGSPAPPFSFSIWDVTQFYGSFNHVQIYKSSTGDPFPFTKHVAQWEQGASQYTGGLKWQRTDERFRTACRYAGLPEPDTDYGTAWMQRAELAGKTFAQMRDEAVRTEQGRAFTAGNGVPTFHSRTRAKYNV